MPLSFLVLTVGLVSCATPTAIPAASPIPTISPSPTSTIVWFPPSTTPTSQTISTYTATAEMNPGIGALLLSDNFADATAWDTAVADEGSAIVNRNRLTLAAGPGVYLESLRRDMTFENFYAEITAHTSLCRAEDKYGLVLRATGTYFYRFVLACNGYIHVERINSGTKLIIYEPVLSGDAPPGAPGELRIGVWAVGAEMRFFLNGRFQFRINDKSFSRGAFGMFARSAGATPVTVSFSNLEIREVNYTAPTRTPSP